MKKTALIKDFLREIKKTFTRFLSITIMIMLGVFVLIGLKVTGPMMRDNATRHTDAQNMYDVKIIGPVGIDDEDLREIKKIDGVETIYPGKLADLNWADKKINISLESLSTDISTPEVIEGRLPEKPGEILIEYIDALKDIKLGDTIEFSKEVDKFKDSDDDDLKTYKYTVVGKCVSTDYIMQGIKGVSIQSGASIDTVGFITDDNFNKKDYSFVKIRFSNIIGKDPESKSYNEFVNAKKNAIKDLLEPRAGVKLAELKDKNNKKIRDGEAEINDAKAKIADAEDKFNKAKIKLDDAKITLDDAKVKIENGKRDLRVNEADARKKIADAKAKIEDGKIKLADAKEQLKKHDKDYNDGLKEYQDGVKKYNDAFDQIEENERRLNSGMQEAEDGAQSAMLGLGMAREGLGKVESALTQVDAGINTLKGYGVSSPEINGKIAALEGQKAALLEQKKQAEAGIASASSGLSQASSAKDELQRGLRQIEDAKDELREKKIELDDAEVKLKDAKTKLDDAKRRLEREEKNLIDGENELKDAEAKLESELRKGKNKIANAIIDFNKGQADYLEGKSEYEEKLADFNIKKKDALVDIESGEKKIADAKDILQNLSEPRFLVKTRKDNDALYFLYESSHNLDIVSWIFPLFFFFIAILVSIATMTRMVEEDRIEIGTYKSLGYGRLDIYTKYILYGLLSSLVGGIIGATLGSTILPKAIYKAYSASYVIKHLNVTPDALINVIAIMFGVLSNVLTIFLVVRSTLNENAASLLRPKAPKKSSKILLERIPFLWKRIKFLNKVTLRNLFRYKARMFMTIFGVAGCAGLVFLGFSLRESIGGIESKQFEEIYKYDITITTDKSLPKGGLDELNAFLKSDTVDDYLNIYIDQVTLDNENGRDQTITLMATEDIDRFGEFVKLKHERALRKEKILKIDSPIINHKLYSYVKDDELIVNDSNLRYYNIKPSADTTDFYVGHALFMNKADYEKYFKKEYEPNSYLVRLSDKQNIKDTIEKLRKNESVLTVQSFDDNLKIIEDWTGSIGIITVIILICSAALAFVVLYNLTNINISERLRELSTIKVLGFTTEELTSYIYRETILLSFIGIIVGFGVGWLLLGTVSQVLSPDNIQMNLLLSFRPYLYSAIITMVFVFIIRLIVIRKLKDIDMVASLKSYE